MANAQQWLGNKYPTPESKTSVKKLLIGGGNDSYLTLTSFSSSSSEPYINGEVAVRFWPHPRTGIILEGSLSLKGFINLEVLDCSFNQLIKLDLSECSKLRELVCHDNKLTVLKLPNNSWISRLFCWNNQLTELVFPNDSHTAREIFCQNNRLIRIVFGKDSNLRFVNCENNQLTSLDLNSGNYSILSYVYCCNNKLTSLILPIHHYIQRLDCSNNQLSNLDFLRDFVIRSPEYFSAMPCGPFTGLKIANNRFSPMDLSILSRFYYLKNLDISKNPFYGSLKPLEGMTSLQWLNINDTDIDRGLEYLPWASEPFYQLRLTAKSENKNSRVKKIEEELKSFEGNLKKWKENWEPKSPEEKMKILEERLSEREKEMNIFRELSENWKKHHQNLKVENAQLKSQFSKNQEDFIVIKKLSEENKDKHEEQVEKLREELKNLRGKNIELEKSLVEVKAKAKPAENLENINRQLEKDLLEANELLAKFRLSKKSKEVNDRILNLQKQIKECQQKTIIDNHERLQIVKTQEQISSLTQELKNLRLENFQAQIQIPPK